MFPLSQLLVQFLPYVLVNQNYLHSMPQEEKRAVLKNKKKRWLNPIPIRHEKEPSWLNKCYSNFGSCKKEKRELL